MKKTSTKDDIITKLLKLIECGVKSASLPSNHFDMLYKIRARQFGLNMPPPESVNSFPFRSGDKIITIERAR